MEPKLSLRRLVWGCLAENLYAKNYSITKNDLYEYAESKGYRGSMTDLFNTAEGMEVINEKGESQGILEKSLNSI